MPVKVSDIIEGQLTNGSNGMQHSRTFRVSGLDSPNAFERHKQALDFVGITRGEPHPGGGDLQFLPAASVTVSMVGNDNTIADVVWTYAIEGESGTPPTGSAAQIEVGATVQSVQTHKDILGNVITVSYTPPATEESPGPHPLDTQGGSVEVQIPLVTFVLTRRESSGQHVLGLAIGQVAKRYVGQTNNDIWQGGAQDTWLCTGITANSTDGGVTFAVRYGFVFNKDTWKARVVYVDSSGRVPLDLLVAGDPGVADADAGDKLVAVLGKRNFREMNLE